MACLGSTLGGRSGRPLTHSCYTTRWDTTPPAAAWFGLLAPAGTPPAVIERTHRAAVGALRAPDLEPRLRELGIQPVGSAPAEFAAHIEREIPRMAAVLEGAGLRAR